MKYSVIDISSSSLSFIVADVEGRSAEVIFKDRITLSLTQYMEGKSLSSRGIEKLISAINEAKQKCTALGVEKAYLIATAALRQIDNFEEVHDAAAKATGMMIKLIDGKAEGRFDLMANSGYATYDRAVLVDIGGASIEICDFSDPSEEGTKFLKFGIFDLNRKFVDDIQPTEDEAKKIKKYVKKKLAEAELSKDGEYSTVVLVGATNNAVYDVYADYAKAEGEEKRIDIKKFKKLSAHLTGDPGRSALVLKSAPERIYMLATAAVVLNTLFRRFRPENVVVSDRGVKEGYLRFILENGEGEEYDFEGETHEKSQPVPVKKARKSAGKKSASKIRPDGTPKRKYVRKKKQDETLADNEQTAPEKVDVQSEENVGDGTKE